MNLRSLLLCADEKIVRVLRRTLDDLEIAVELFTSAQVAVNQLGRERFEAIIVDCAGPGAVDVLRSSRSAPLNRRAVAVAILDPYSGLRSAFELGANFVLYKPVTVERAKSSFRAARALMKKERRRSARVSVQLSVEMSSGKSGSHLTVSTRDVSEGGLAILLPRRCDLGGRWQLSFMLPGSDVVLEVAAELAWEGVETQVGLHFEDPSTEVVSALREWILHNSPESWEFDPGISCQLANLSLGACYLMMDSPFPVSTRVTLSMRIAGNLLRAEGVVRIAHPERGMGVEFTQSTPEHRQLLEKFMGILTETHDVPPEFTVEPEGFEVEHSSSAAVAVEAGAEIDDPLIRLFREMAVLPADSFMEALRNQRGLGSEAAGASV